jgi:erythromycin esterase
MYAFARRSLVAGTALALVAGCHSAPPPPPPPPPAPLSDSAAAALRWVDAHVVGFGAADSVATASERSGILGLTDGARIIGISELTEGVHEFPLAVRRLLFTLVDSGVRGLAIQAPMPEALDVDRYVRTGIGDPRRLLRALGSWRWETREMFALVAAMREWDRTHGSDRQLGFYGFEIGTAAHAVAVITSMPDSIAGAPLNVWLRTQYNCVQENESAHWGLEGRASDSTFWNRCGPMTTVALDSIEALKQRTTVPSRANTLAYVERMARLVQHHVAVGLRHMTRHGANAEHVLFVANSLGSDARLLVWGGDVEMGRLTLDRTTVQTGVPLGDSLKQRFRNIAFAVGDGVVRARRPATGPRVGGEPSGLMDVPLRAPTAGMFEDVFSRARSAGFWLDARALPADTAGKWLHGPHQMRLITELYAPEAADAFRTPIELPTNYDAVLFIKHVTAAKQ